MDEERIFRNSPDRLKDLEDNLKINPLSAQKLAKFIDIYEASNEVVGKEIGATNFRLIESYNNLVFEFNPEVKDQRMALKVFKDGPVGKTRYETEIKAHNLIESCGLFQPHSGVLVPPVLFFEKEISIIGTKYIDGIHTNLEPTELQCRQIVDFLIRLNDLKISTTNLEIISNRSLYSADSPYETYTDVVRRIHEFDEWIKKNENPTITSWVNNNNLQEQLERATVLFLKKTDPRILHKTVEVEDLRFNWGDVSPSNMCFTTRGDKQILVPLDLEYSGWDHFSSGISNLLLHHNSEEMPASTKSYLLDKFIADSRLTKQQIDELHVRMNILNLLFITRKLKPVMLPANDTRIIKSRRIPNESYSMTKIRLFLEPAVKRLQNLSTIF